MGDVRDIDIETFGKSRLTRLREKLGDLVCSFSRRGWKQTDARIENCAAMQVIDGFGGYAVALSYEVDGESYQADAVSPVEVEKGDTIKIRYNPRHPEQNNSFDSETNWTSPAFRIRTILMVLVLLGLLAAGIIMRK
jgi:hypothetical protein